MVNNLYQEAQRDDWHGQIVRWPEDKFIWRGYRNIEEQIEHFQSRIPQWRRETLDSLYKLDAKSISAREILESMESVVVKIMR